MPRCRYLAWHFGPSTEPSGLIVQLTWLPATPRPPQVCKAIPEGRLIGPLPLVPRGLRLLQPMRLGPHLDLGLIDRLEVGLLVFGEVLEPELKRVDPQLVGPGRPSAASMIEQPGGGREHASPGVAAVDEDLGVSSNAIGDLVNVRERELGSSSEPPVPWLLGDQGDEACRPWSRSGPHGRWRLGRLPAARCSWIRSRNTRTGRPPPSATARPPPAPRRRLRTWSRTHPPSPP